MLFLQVCCSVHTAIGIQEQVDQKFNNRKGGLYVTCSSLHKPSSTCRARFRGGKVYAWRCRLLRVLIRVHSRVYCAWAKESRLSVAGQQTTRLTDDGKECDYSCEAVFTDFVSSPPGNCVAATV